MIRSIQVAALLLMLAQLTATPVQACGFGEAPGGCGETPESEAKYMLQRVVNAVDADKAKALREFAHGDDGFRTVDTYVFCVGPDGVMTAHPSPVDQPKTVGVETCKICRSYIKHIQQHEDGQLDPVADDIATYALDLLAREDDFRRSSINPFFLTG